MSEFEDDTTCRSSRSQGRSYGPPFHPAAPRSMSRFQVFARWMLETFSGVILKYTASSLFQVGKYEGKLALSCPATQ